MNNILLADKGNATIILATVYYHNKMASLLHDTIYRCLPADPTAKTEWKIAVPIYKAVSKISRISSVVRQQMAARGCAHSYSDLQS
jgi:hypothetical protein